MAKLDSVLGFTGSLGRLSAYKMKGSEETILRRKGGPSKEYIRNSPNCEITRRNNIEFGGRAAAAGWIMRGLHMHKALADYNMAGPLQALLRPIQLLDDKSELGERHVQLSKNPRLLEGFSLNRKWVFDSVIRSPVNCRITKDDLSAELNLPSLLPGINFFPPPKHPLFCISVVLALVPDVFCREGKYEPGKEYGRHYLNWQETRSQWLATGSRSEEQSFRLKLEQSPPYEFFSLMVSAGIVYGMVTAPGSQEQAAYAGSAKVVAMM